MGRVDLANKTQKCILMFTEVCTLVVHAFVLVFVETSIINAKFQSCVCPTQDTKKLAHRAFRLQLAKELTGTYTARQTTGRPS